MNMMWWLSVPVVQVFVRELLDTYRASDLYTGGPTQPA